jgi:hypothetical protein
MTTLPAPILSIAVQCDSLKRRIAERQRAHRGYRDLEFQLIRARAKQLRAERRWEKHQARKAA